MRLPEEVETGSVFPLRVLDANLVRRHHGPPDAPVCGLHQSDGNPTLYVSSRPRVGLLPLFCEATGYPFQVFLQRPLRTLSTPVSPRERALRDVTTTTI